MKHPIIGLESLTSDILSGKHTLLPSGYSLGPAWACGVAATETTIADYPGDKVPLPSATTGRPMRALAPQGAWCVGMGRDGPLALVLLDFANVDVIMFLCACRLPSFAPGGVPSRARNQVAAGSTCIPKYTNM